MDELATLLLKLPNELRRQAIDASLRAGVRVKRKRILASLGGVMRSRSPNRRDIVAVKAKGKGSAFTQAFIIGNNVNFPELFWLEFGTAPHVITARRGESLHFNESFPASVSHPGQPPRPYFRRAWNASNKETLEAMAEKLGQSMVKAARKLGSAKFRGRILRGRVR